MDPRASRSRITVKLPAMKGVSQMPSSCSILGTVVRSPYVLIFNDWIKLLHHCSKLLQLARRGKADKRAGYNPKHIVTRLLAIFF